MPDLVAISIKQPWAALLVAGLKTIEVRTWRTRRRGQVLVHAAKMADDRPEAWELVKGVPALMEATRLRGGLVGAGEIVACREYATAEVFAADAAGHRNPPAWFAPPRLFGFVFQNLHPIEYHPCPGQTMFFEGEGFTLS